MGIIKNNFLFLNVFNHVVAFYFSFICTGSMTSMVGLPSDRALVEDDECVGWISKYAEDQSLFFDDFKNAYTKLVDTGATWKKAL